MRQWVRVSRAVMRPLLLLQFFLLLGLVGTGCYASAAVEPSAAQEADTLSTEDLDMLSHKTIFFGHQSVGWNIIEGVEDVLKEKPGTQLSIQKAESIDGVQSPAFIHTEVGRNYEPLSKLQAFEQFVRNGVGGKADVAFFKFCYVDFDKNTDVDQLFTTYKQTMASLTASYPQTQFAYVTVPLMAPDQGLKSLVKSVLGRNDSALANMKRHQFNELLRAEYGGKAPLFDLAQVEATYANGKTCTVTVNNQTVPCLSPDYTDDGGHLNERGRKVMAEQFLKFLATLE